MDKLISTNNGGMPLDNDDFRFIDDGIREVIKGIMGGFLTSGITEFIISGCDISEVINGGNTEYTVSEGYIYRNGEVFYVPAHLTIGATSHTAYWDEYFYYDPSGNETFEDLTSHDTYQKRQMKLYTSAAPPGGYMPKESNSIATQLKLKLGLEVDIWHEVANATTGLGTTFNTDWTSAGLVLNWSLLRFKKMPNGNVKIEGAAKVTNAPPSTEIIFTLPIGYRPLFFQTFGVIQWLNVPVYEGSGTIDTNGDVKIENAAYTVSDTFIFNIEIPLD